MCLYNGEEFLEKSLKSLSGLDYQNYEIIILDNQSTDTSLQIVRRFMKDDHRIKLYVDTKRRNGYDGYTEILKYCTGDFIINFNDDDFIAHNALNELYAELIKTNSDGVFANGFFMDRDENILSKFFKFKLDFNSLNKKKQILLFYRLRFNVPFLFGLFRKNKILKLLPYENIDQTLQDTDTLFSAKIISNLNIRYLDKNLHYYRQYPDHERWHDPKHGSLDYLNSFKTLLLFQFRHELLLFKKFSILINEFSLSLFFFCFYNLIKKLYTIFRNI